MLSTYFNCLRSGCLYRSIEHPFHRQLSCRIACLLFSAGTYTEGGFTCRPQRTLHVESLGCSFASSVSFIMPYFRAVVKLNIYFQSNHIHVSGLPSPGFLPNKWIHCTHCCVHGLVVVNPMRMRLLSMSRRQLPAAH